MAEGASKSKKKAKKGFFSKAKGIFNRAKNGVKNFFRRG